VRILQILEKNQFNTGSVHQMFQAAEGLRARGHEVAVVSREGDELRGRATERGIAFHSLPFRHEADLATIAGLRRIVRNTRPDVIHVHKGLSHTLALVATWWDRVPAFVVNRGVSFPLSIWNRGKFRTRRVDRIVTVCQDIKDVVVASGGLPDEKVAVVYAGVDLELFDSSRWSRDEFRLEKGIGSNRFVIMQVGVRDWKGWRELIDAFVAVAGERPEAHLVLVACRDHAQEEEVRRYAAERGAGQAVTPVEYRSDMARVLTAADVVVDASWAGTGITGTIREAMALGKPVIATDCGGNRELISSAEVGWLVPLKQREALTAAIREVIGDRGKRERIAGQGQLHVRAGFSKERRIERLEALYRSIVARKAL